MAFCEPTIPMNVARTVPPNYLARDLRVDANVASKLRSSNAKKRSGNIGSKRRRDAFLTRQKSPQKRVAE